MVLNVEPYCSHKNLATFTVAFASQSSVHTGAFYTHTHTQYASSFYYIWNIFCRSKTHQLSVLHNAPMWRQLIPNLLLLLVTCCCSWKCTEMFHPTTAAAATREILKDDIVFDKKLFDFAVAASGSRKCYWNYFTKLISGASRKRQTEFVSFYLVWLLQKLYF